MEIEDIRSIKILTWRKGVRKKGGKEEEREDKERETNLVKRITYERKEKGKRRKEKKK